MTQSCCFLHKEARGGLGSLCEGQLRPLASRHGEREADGAAGGIIGCHVWDHALVLPPDAPSTGISTRVYPCVLRLSSALVLRTLVVDGT